ncbi:MAG: hypothetical protein LAP13_27755 [Acidobacteriia bacterium]|nr:hypothetical protein [Terriglobia bacterium]
MADPQTETFGRPVQPVPDVTPDMPEAAARTPRASFGRPVQPESSPEASADASENWTAAPGPSEGAAFGRPVEPVRTLEVFPENPPLMPSAPKQPKAAEPGFAEKAGRALLATSPLGLEAGLAYDTAKAHPEWTAKDYLEKPLTETVYGLPEEWSRKGAGKIEAGIEKGVTSFATDLSTPLSVGLMIATGGLGSLAKGLGAEGLTAVAPELAPKVINAARVASKLVNAGFTIQQLAGLGKAVPDFIVAAKNGDTENAARAAVNGMLSGAAAALSTAHLIGESGPQKWTAEHETIGCYQNQVEMHNVEARAFERENAALIKNTPLDVAARLYHEAGGDTAVLDRWKAELQTAKGIKPEVRQKYTGLLEQAKNLPPEVTTLSDRLRAEYASDWNEAAKAHKLDPERAKAGAANYAGQHTYEPASEGDSTLRPTARQITKTPGFMKHRSFDTLLDAIKAGFEPKDVGLAAARADYIRRFGEVRGAIEAENSMLAQRADDGRPVAVAPGMVRQLGNKSVIPLSKETAAANTAFVSPNTEEGTTLDTALQGLGSERHREFHQLAQNVLEQAGGGIVRDAIGAWKDGAENSLLLKTDTDAGTLRYVAALLGREANQKSVIPFVDDPEGQDFLLSFKVRRGNLTEIGQTLDRLGIEYRTLEPAGKDVRVHVFDPGGSLAEKVRQAGEHYGAEVTYKQGRGEFLGADSRPDARAIFNQVIQEYEQAHPEKSIRLGERQNRQGTSGNNYNRPAPRAQTLSRADLSQFDYGDIIEKDGKLYLDISDYQKASPPFERYKVMTNDEDGSPVFKKAPVMIHPDYAEKINRAFETDSWFRRTPLVSGLLRVSAGAKQLLLSLSPFHYNTEYLRGLQMGLDPVTAFRPPELTPERPAVQVGTRYGLTLLGDRAAKSAAAEGVAGNSEILSRVPGIGPVLENVQDHLFGNWIPRLKAETWERLVPQLERAHPNWTPEQRYVLAAKITNAAYGGLNWRQLGWSLSSVDALRLVALAPDFTGSQLAFAKYGLQPGGSVVWQSFARIALYNFGVAQTLNLLFGGKMHPEHPFSVVSPTDKSKVISIRTMPADIFHGLTDPRGFVYNRLNPLLVRTTVEAATGRDIRGQKVGAERQVVDLLRNVTPISLQNFVPSFRYADQTTGESALRGAGLTVAQDVSPALRLARQLASDRAPSGPVASDEAEHHRFKLQLEDALRAGTVKREALPKLVDAGQLTRAEAREIVESVREARKITDPLIAQLVLRLKHLPMPQALQVYDTATNAERRALASTMRTKRIAYRQNAYRDLTARERAGDAVFQRTQAETFR